MGAGAFFTAVFVCTVMGVLSLRWLSLSYGHRSLVAIGYELLVVAGAFLAFPTDNGQLLAFAIGGLAIIVIAVRGVHLAIRSLMHEIGRGVGILGLLGNLAMLIFGALPVLIFAGFSQMH